MPEISPAAEHLLAALSADPIDRERILTWASCGFNARRASRARPDLGKERTFQDAVKRHQSALAAALRAIFADSAPLR